MYVLNKRVKMNLNRSHEIGTKVKLATPQAAMLFGRSNLFYLFDRSFCDHSYQIILNSDHRFHRSIFTKSLLS